MLRGEGGGVGSETARSLSLGQLRQSGAGGAAAAAGAGVCSLKLQGHYKRAEEEGVCAPSFA